MDPQQGPPQADLLIGQTVGNYLVTQKLGEGGMGSVYLAEHPSIGKKVALKILHSEFSSNEEVTRRFFNEAKAVNDIGHPNIVDIHDFGIIQAGGRDNLVYFIMEYLNGVTLSHLIRTESPIPPERALSIALQIADALGSSHKCGIVHRDLKPDNVILIQRGRERDFVKLLDFGIAKLTNDNVVGSHRTRTGIVMGTPAYMSPEQCEGRGTIDHRTDIYALGILLYEMLVGRVPFIGEGYGEILVQHLTQPPVPPSQYRMMNMHVEAVVMKALEKRPDFRYPTMDEMMRALADPVGYVESHGGIQGFMQRQLMPSSAPLPPVRLTPAPMTTPVPGHLTPYGLSTPSPTTLGSAAGQVTGGKSKTGLLVMGAAVVIATAVAIFMVMKKDQAVDGGDGSGSEVIAAGSDGSEGSAESGSDRTVEHGSAGSAQAGSAEVGSAGGSAAGSAALGSAGSDAGSAKLPELASIRFTTKPAGAKIILNGVALDERTPEAFELGRNKKPAKIILRLDRYEDIVIDNFVATGDVDKEYTFKKKRATPPNNRGSAQRGSNTGGTGNDTGLMRPD